MPTLTVSGKTYLALFDPLGTSWTHEINLPTDAPDCVCRKVGAGFQYRLVLSPSQWDEAMLAMTSFVESMLTEPDLDCRIDARAVQRDLRRAMRENA